MRRVAINPVRSYHINIHSAITRSRSSGWIARFHALMDGFKNYMGFCPGKEWFDKGIKLLGGNFWFYVQGGKLGQFLRRITKVLEGALIGVDKS
jgi:hypothetical protein